MMSAKMAFLGPVKINVFWNNICDVIISVCDFINKNISRDSNYIVDAAMWPKFGNSIKFVREVIMTLIL